MFWGAEPVEAKKPELVEEEITPKQEKQKGKGKKPAAANAWNAAPKLTPDPVQQQQQPKPKKTAPQKPNAWGSVPKVRAKGLDEIMSEDKAESLVREAELEREHELQQQQKQEAERRAKNAWGVINTPSGSSSLTMTEENFPSLAGGSSSSATRTATKAATRTQPGNGGLAYSRAVGQVAPSASHMDEAFPPLGGVAPTRKGKH